MLGVSQVAVLADEVQSLKCGITTSKARCGYTGPSDNSAAFVLAGVSLFNPSVAFGACVHFIAGDGLNGLEVEHLRQLFEFLLQCCANIESGENGRILEDLHRCGAAIAF